MKSSSSEVSESSIIDESPSDSESKTSESDISLCSSFFFALPIFFSVVEPSATK